MKLCQEQMSIFCLEASHDLVSPSLSPDSAKGKTMTAISGQRCCASSPRSGPLGLLAKMLLESSLWRSHLRDLRWKAEALHASRIRTCTKRYSHDKRNCCSTVSSMTSVRSATKSRHFVYRLVASARTTSDTESQLWATPNTMDHLPQRPPEALERQAKSTRKGRKKVSNLREQVNPETAEMWTGMFATPNAADCRGTTGGGQSRSLRTDVKMFPTPRANDAEKRGNLANDPRNGLPAAVLWPTPTTRDHKDGTAIGCKNVPANALLGRTVHLYPTPNASNANGVGEHGDGGKNLQTEVGGQLNPEWVCVLMGFPPGWAILTD